MAIYCPAINEKVLYLTCLECEDKICKQKTDKIQDNSLNEKNKTSPVKDIFKDKD